MDSYGAMMMRRKPFFSAYSLVLLAFVMGGSLIVSPRASAQTPKTEMRNVVGGALSTEEGDVKIRNYVLKIKQDAQRGDAKAQYHLAMMYYAQTLPVFGIPQSFTQALMWFTQSARQGESDAQFMLGFMYESGQGVSQNYSQAANWFIRAAKQGDTGAQVNLGVMYHNGLGVSRNDNLAMEWVAEAAKRGDEIGQYALGAMYLKGWGTSQNYSLAVQWFVLAAKQGSANAEATLGNMYEEGLGVPRNYDLAVQWYTKAAKQSLCTCNKNQTASQGDGQNLIGFLKYMRHGALVAQNRLGNMYLKGRGVPQNYGLAVKWYTEAARQGYVFAQNNLGEMYLEGLGVPQNYGLAAKWYAKAAEQGLAGAQCMLGFRYEFGQGVPQSSTAAYALLNAASLEDESCSSKARDLVAKKLSVTEIETGWVIGQQIYLSGNLAALNQYLNSSRSTERFSISGHTQETSVLTP